MSFLARLRSRFSAFSRSQFLAREIRLFARCSSERFLAAAHIRHSRSPRFMLRLVRFSGTSSCPALQCVFRAFRADRLLLRILFSLPVTASKCAGLQHLFLRHRWSISSPSGMGPLASLYVHLCMYALRFFPPRVMTPYL